jgi:protein-S-isoprenylcysteine O-methyltransferase Ste14
VAPENEMNEGSALAGKIAYGALFALGVPLLLAGWAKGTERFVPLPAPRSLPLGLTLVVLGVALVAAGMWALRVHGGGLPMNAFPPPRFVERGAYALVSHPIYVGFCAAVLGTSLATGSPSGLWMITPLTALACAALVLGYERHDLEQRFGVPHARSLLRLPDESDSPPSLRERLVIVPFVLVPALALRALLALLPPPPDALSTLLPGEASWPSWPLGALLGVAPLPLVFFAALLAPTRALLRRLTLGGLFALVLTLAFQLCIPLVAAPRGASISPSLAWLTLDPRPGSPAFPSLPVLLLLLSASAFAARFPRARALVWLIAASLLAARLGSAADSLLLLLGSVGLGLVLLRARGLWELSRRGSERIANSWHEWQLGPVRIINHGAYAGAATTVGAIIVGALAGPESTFAILIVCLSALICAGIWAQVIEGSSQLLRPYGFYGGVIGIILGAFLAPLAGSSTWLMLAACSVAGPFVQSIGRLRCLVQGCCHGYPAPPSIGIRYTHPRSRVLRLAHLAGVPLHPTPLYSILWNVVIALTLGRLHSLHAELHLIGGLYLVLTGLGRFVEESYRGEPQTKIWARLRLYQWIAIGTVLIGIVVTIFGRSGPAPSPAVGVAPFLAALALGLVTGAALGVDFPASKKRFSRLA